MNANLETLLRLFIGKAELADVRMTVDDLSDAFVAAKEQSVAGVLYHIAKDVFETMPKSDELRSLKYNWLAYAAMIDSNNRLLEERSLQFAGVVTKCGLSSCLLKGTGLSAVYPPQAYRQCGDIDMWVRNGRRKVIGALASIGKIDSVTYHHAHMHWIPDVSVEIHYRPTWFYNPVYNTRFTKWVKSEESRQFPSESSSGYSVPTVDFNLVYLIIHMFRHLFGEGICLKQVMDYYFIVLKSGSSDREVAYHVLVSLGMGGFVSAVMYLLQELFYMDEEYLLCVPSPRYGKNLLNIVFSNEKKVYGSKGSGFAGRCWASLERSALLSRYYPSEALWAPIWKSWHLLWRLFHRVKMDGSEVWQ